MGDFDVARYDPSVDLWGGGGGYWGTVAASCPALDVTVVAQDGQAWMPDAYRKSDIVGEVLRLF